MPDTPIFHSESYSHSGTSPLTVQRYPHQGWLWYTTSACGVTTGDVAARGPAAGCPLPGPGSAAWGDHHGTPLAFPATSHICAPTGIAGELGSVIIVVTSIDGRELIGFAYCAESPCLAVFLCGPTRSISLPASIICLRTCISTGAASTVWGSAHALTATAASVDASSHVSCVFTVGGVLLGPPPPVTSYCTPVTVIDAPGGGLHGSSSAVGLAGTFGCFAVARVDGRFAVARLDGLAGSSSAVGHFADGSAVDCLAVARLDGCFAVVHVNSCFTIELLDGLASSSSAVGSFADGSPAVGSATEQYRARRVGRRPDASCTLGLDWANGDCDRGFERFTTPPACVALNGCSAVASLGGCLADGLAVGRFANSAVGLLAVARLVDGSVAVARLDGLAGGLGGAI